MGNGAFKSYPVWWNTSKSDFKTLKRDYNKTKEEWDEIVQHYRQDFATRYRHYHDTYAEDLPFDEKHARWAQKAKVYPDAQFIKEHGNLLRYGAKNIYHAQTADLTGEQTVHWINTARMTKTLSRDQMLYWVEKADQYATHREEMFRNLEALRDPRDAARVAEHIDLLSNDQKRSWYWLCQQNDRPETETFYNCVKAFDAAIWTLEDVVAEADSVPFNILSFWFAVNRNNKTLHAAFFRRVQDYDMLENDLFEHDIKYWVEESGEPVPRRVLSRYCYTEHHAYNANDAYCKARAGVLKKHEYYRAGEFHHVSRDTRTQDMLPAKSLGYWWLQSRDSFFTELIVATQPQNVLDLALEDPHPIFIEHLCATEKERYADVCEHRWLETANPVWLYLCLTNGIVPDGARDYFEPLVTNESAEAVYSLILDRYPDETISFLTSLVDCDANGFEHICSVLNREPEQVLNVRIACAMIDNCLSDPRENQLLRDLIMTHPHKTQLVDALIRWNLRAPPDYEA
ncbi:MAG: hypothetical protein CMP20_01495 [Rickettsiales bacterium]|nr:hypothetical protein [Rickettsiales bacterium]